MCRLSFDCCMIIYIYIYCLKQNVKMCTKIKKKRFLPIKWPYYYTHKCVLESITTFLNSKCSRVFFKEFSLNYKTIYLTLCAFCNNIAIKYSGVYFFSFKVKNKSFTTLAKPMFPYALPSPPLSPNCNAISKCL